MKLSPADIANIEAMLETGGYSGAEHAVHEALAVHRHMIESLKGEIGDVEEAGASPAELVFERLRARLEAKIAGGDTS